VSDITVFISQQGAEKVVDEINRYRLFGKEITADTRPFVDRGQYRGHRVRLRNEDREIPAGWLRDEQHDTVIQSRAYPREPWWARVAH